jgi:ABC-type taurine transport system ATPase subunit
MKSFVDIQDVTLVYARAEDGAPAVEQLNLTVKEGEFAAIVGPSGCGKSTLMKLATGLQFPKKGTVIVDGKEVGAPVKLAGMAFQNPTMLPWRGIVVRDPRSARGEQRHGHSRHARSARSGFPGGSHFLHERAPRAHRGRKGGGISEAAGSRDHLQRRFCRPRA